jgi:hypothetical protein
MGRPPDDRHATGRSRTTGSPSPAHSNDTGGGVARQAAAVHHALTWRHDQWHPAGDPRRPRESP